MDDRERWRVTLTFAEDDVATRVRAVLDTGGGRAVTARGWARRNPVDPSLPRVGEDIAAARSLRALAEALLADASATLGEDVVRGVRAPAGRRPLAVERELIHPGG